MRGVIVMYVSLAFRESMLMNKSLDLGSVESSLFLSSHYDLNYLFIFPFINLL